MNQVCRVNVVSPVAVTSRARVVANRQCCTPLPKEGALTPCIDWPVSPLSLRLESWSKCTASEWVLKTLSRGYRLQFAANPPPFRGVIQSQVVGEAAHFLREEISSLLEKGAIKIVPPSDSKNGYYSRYFLVKKKGGNGIRAILDLRDLNKHLRKYKFRMLTHASLLRFLRAGDWFTSIDLKDAYFHIPIYPPHRKYLRFAFQGTSYEYLVLPFGLSLSPRVFVKCTEAAVTPLRRQGVRIATYIDDWLIAASSHQEAADHTRLLTEHLGNLGFRINLEKSVLLPCQTISFIGLFIDSAQARVKLTGERLQALRDCLDLFQRGKFVSFRLCHRLLGLMASALVVVPMGRLYMKGIQRWVASHRLDPRRQGSHRVRVSVDCTAALIPWRKRGFLTQGVPMGVVLCRKLITTDASLVGWGGVCEGRAVNGTWEPHMHVLVRTDNTTVVAYINRQGGLRSLQLHTLAHRLIVWSSNHFLSLKATHVPGVLNHGADLLSRGNPLYAEWRLHPSVVNLVWERYGQPSVDLFATGENSQCPLFFSLHDQNAPLGVDAFAHQWPHVLLYAFPPIALISPTLARVQKEGLSMILIAPYWPSKHWLAEITRLLYREPWPLPIRRDLLTQAHGQIFHPHPERLALWAWPVSGLT
ncbi:uncharacterized protein LOC115360460 [Myripristis murdjan]|uniref:uncharacterized protein LOC115360460 n=1 Tax=Myripristis murdjan TaxID=586833 RepID=UPI001176470B|nr:uncharacterized protein LOC115360460 [Myripristis murdjan]